MAPAKTEMNDSEKKLVEFINAGKTAEVQLMVGDPDVNVNCLDDSGMTPLQHASYKGNEKLVDYLLCHGADVNSNEHDHGYTALMFAALSGSLGCVRALLEAGAKTGHTNSVGRNAAQMAGFVGQHQVVSLINNFFSREDLEYFTVPQGIETEPKLPPELSPMLYKLIINNVLNPIKIVHYLQVNPRLIDGDSGKKVARVLDRLVEKMMKAHDTNEVMAMKFHYLESIVKRCDEMKKQKPDDNLATLVRNLLRPNDQGALANQDHFVRSVLRTFPYAESQLLQQMVMQLAKTPIGGSPSSLSILNSGINGNRFQGDEDAECSTCGEFKAAKKCAACKMVHYCDQWCQKTHWFIHKKECKLLAEEFKRREEEIKIQQEKDRQKKEEEEKMKKEKEENTEEKSDEKTNESSNGVESSDGLSEKMEKTTIKGEDREMEGRNERSGASEGQIGSKVGQERSELGHNCERSKQGQERSELGQGRSSEGEGGVKGAGEVKKASWGKGRGKKGRKGRKRQGYQDNPGNQASSSGMVPGCEKNSTGVVTQSSKASDQSKIVSMGCEGNSAEGVEGNVEVEDIEVEISGEKVHIVDDVTDLKAQGEGVGEGGEVKGRKGKKQSGKGKCPYSGSSQGVQKKGQKITEGKTAGKCPYSGVTSGTGDVKVNEKITGSRDSTTSGQALPLGHPSGDISGSTTGGVGDNRGTPDSGVDTETPKKPMMDLRMFCPKFASGELSLDDEMPADGVHGVHGAGTGLRQTQDEFGEPVDMEDFIRGFQDFLAKKKEMDKKARHVDDVSTSEEEED